MRKPQISIRLSGEALEALGREVVRLTVNPVLLSLGRRFVDFGGWGPPGEKLRPSELVLRASRRFPRLPLSWAVEGYIGLLLADNDAGLKPFPVETCPDLDQSVRRFRALSPAGKIRVGERWKRELRLLRGAE